MIQSMLGLRVARKAGSKVVPKNHKWNRNSTSYSYKNRQLDVKLELTSPFEMLN